MERHQRNQSPSHEVVLQEALLQAKKNASEMKRALDFNDLDGSLVKAAACFQELQADHLSPKEYYQLYAQISDDMTQLEEVFQSLIDSGTTAQELYERVQWNARIVPRLYMLIGVGQILVKENPVLEVLADLLDMVRGVQSPLRGLFLRYHLVVTMKTNLTRYAHSLEGVAGTKDVIDFLMQNLSETSRLWIRVHHQSMDNGLKKSSDRETERKDLQVLVGTSLVRLSELSGLTCEIYSDRILPPTLDLIRSSKDDLAQEYLLECIIHVFPDEFHAQNLELFLDTFTKCVENVDVASILRTLLNRLENYTQSAEASRSIFSWKLQSEENNFFHMLLKTIVTISEKCRKMKHSHITSMVSLLIAIVKLHEDWLRGNMDRINDLVSCISSFVHLRGEDLEQEMSVRKSEFFDAIEDLVVALVCLLRVSDWVRVSKLISLKEVLPHISQKRIAVGWMQFIVRNNDRVQTEKEAEILFEFLMPLIRDNVAETLTTSILSSKNSNALEVIEKEQVLLAKLLHIFYSEDLEVKFRMFTIARRSFGQGVLRLRYTLVPLIHCSLALTQQLKQASTHAEDSPQQFGISPRQVLQFVHEMVTALASKSEQMSLACVNLFLQCAIVADFCELDAITYEFTIQALIVYEDQISQSGDQSKALGLISASLRATTSLSPTNYETLATKVTQFGAKVNKKEDQALVILSCAHLFWHPGHQNGKLVLECLQRSLRVVDGLEKSAKQVSLFLEILEAYFYFHNVQVAEVSQRYLHGLLALVKEHLANMESDQAKVEGESRYRAIQGAIDSEAS
uniref:Vacuolar protein sorting-associated protein 35 n=1 Tax=Albugo laibachii Nc14 TaxID=890382 RepID=F0WCQ9_9STRA|nr:vacuolar protein sortingassociated protein 35 putati [Albugo laibachii Nc14]|eukprot:CCA18980.1 vacuolar protein sortingassociated protein 35 putati [Albugo laibachii Nc14]